MSVKSTSVQRDWVLNCLSSEGTLKQDVDVGLEIEKPFEIWAV